MFGNKTAIIYIKSDTVEVAKVSLGGEAKVQKEKTYQLQENNFLEVFSEIKKAYGKDFRILLSDDKSYCFTMEVPDSNGNLESKVKDKLQEIIPTSLRDIYYDWKEVKLNKDKVIIQIFAVNRSYLSQILAAADSNDIFIEAFEAVSYALARLTETYNYPQLLLITDTKPIAIVSEKGSVLISTSIESFDEIVKLVNYTKDRLNKTIKRVVIAEDIKKGTDAITKKLNLKVAQKDLDPRIGLALKSDLKGRDASVLNYEYEKLVQDLPGERAKKKSDKKKDEKKEENEQEELDEEDETDKEDSIDVRHLLEDDTENEDEDEDEEISYKEEKTKKKRKNQPLIRREFVVALIFVIVAAAVAVGLILMNRGDSEPTNKYNNPPTQDTETDSSAEADPRADKDPVTQLHELNIQLLSLDPIGGKERDLVDFLFEKGYSQIALVENKEPDLYPLEKTTILVSEKNKEMFNLLLADLKQSKYVTNAELRTLDEEGDFDVIIVVEDMSDELSDQ